MRNLEKLICYGFIVGVALGILFIPYKDTQTVDGGSYISYKHPMEYIIVVLRVGIIGGIVGAVIKLIKNKQKKS